MKHIAIALLFGGIAVASAQDKIPLTTDLPKVQITGTPVPISRPNLETDAKGAQILVPPGVTNLAAGKKVTSSDSEPLLGTLDLITDGDKDADEGCWVELAKGKQWVQIDLEATREIHAIWVWHFHSQKRAYDDVVIQVSDDPEFARDVTTVFNNDHDNSSGLGAGKDPAYIETNGGRAIDAKGVKARYVRLYSAGNTSVPQNHYVEVEVHGK